MTNKHGQLVILEGLDACGKDTQADLLVERLGYIKTRLPEYSYESGKLLRKMIDDGKVGTSEETFQTLMLANYVEHFQKVILPLLESGKNVVMTRAWGSMLAYSRAFGGSRGYIEDIVRSFKSNILAGRHMYITELYIKIPVDVSMERIRRRDEQTDQKQEVVFENDSVLTAVKEAMDEDNYEEDIVSGTGSVEEVYKNILEKI